MNNQVKFISKQFELQNRLFKNAVLNVEENRNEQINQFTNHLAWISGHIVNTRYMMAGMLGLDVQPPHPDLFHHGSKIDLEATYPTIDSTVSEFDAISEKIIEALNNTGDSIMGQKAPVPCPMGDTIGDLFSFFAHHEAYHIGQIGILRKYFGNEAMSYN